MAATIKGNIRRYVNEGNNCETSAEFVKAAGSTSYTTITAGKITCSNMIDQKVQCPGIKQFKNIQYEIKQNSFNYGYYSMGTTLTIQVTVWRAFGIGKQHRLQQKLMTIYPIEIIAKQNNNEWKSEGTPCYRKRVYQSFCLHSQNTIHI